MRTASTNRHGRTRVAAAVIAALLSVLWLGSPAQAAASGSYLRLAHLSPDTPAVDVYIDSVSDPTDSLTLRGVTYGTLSEYQRIAGGTYTVSMRPAGADAASPPVISTTVDAPVGSAHTVAATGPFAALGLTVLTDDLTLPPAGDSRVRVIQASASEAELDIGVDGGPTLATGLPFASTSGYSTVPAGNWTLRVTGTSATPTTLPVTLNAGTVYSVLVLDQSGGGLAVSTNVDAVDTGAVPDGSVQTGGGGTAPGTEPIVALLIVGTGLLVAAGFVARRRTT